MSAFTDTAMNVMLNGRLVPAEDARVSVFDRGFLYGDGVFETLRVYSGTPFQWVDHMDRLVRGWTELGIDPPFTPDQLRAQAVEVLRANQFSDAILRITMSRGPGPRGYSPRKAGPATVVITAEPAPGIASVAAAPLRLITSRFRVPSGSPLTALKSGSKLLQVLAKAEAEEAGVDEAILLNESGNLAECIAANLFWFDPGSRTIATPGLEQGALDGVTRRLALRILRDQQWPVRFAASPPEVLIRSSGAFVTLSSRGFVEVESLDGHTLARDARFGLLWTLYRESVLRSISD